MIRLRVLRGDTPRLKPKLEGGSATFRPFGVGIVDWSWHGGRATLFVLLLPPGLKRELDLLCADLGERFESEE